MPVLARVIESHGIPTVTVTMMPDLAQKFRLSRVVGVEAPFGHSFGVPGDEAFELAVSRAALRALAEAGEPGYRLDVDVPYPVPDDVAYRTWHPPEPSPIVAMMLKRRAEQQADGQ
ncbi:MAG: hypothetical protein Kow0010_11640 [Dehalococcoidia bacterium]